MLFLFFFISLKQFIIVFIFTFLFVSSFCSFATLERLKQRGKKIILLISNETTRS